MSRARNKMQISSNGAVYCPNTLCYEVFYFTEMTFPKFCPGCGRELDWSNMLVCLPEAECNNPDEEVEIMFFKDGGKYNDDVRIKVGEEAAIIPRGKKVRVKRKIAESIKKQMREEAEDFEEKLLQVCELK